MHISHKAYENLANTASENTINIVYQEWFVHFRFFSFSQNFALRFCFCFTFRVFIFVCNFLVPFIANVINQPTGSSFKKKNVNEKVRFLFILVFFDTKLTCSSTNRVTRLNYYIAQDVKTRGWHHFHSLNPSKPEATGFSSQFSLVSIKYLNMKWTKTYPVGILRHVCVSLN